MRDSRFGCRALDPAGLRPADSRGHCPHIFGQRFCCHPKLGGRFIAGGLDGEEFFGETAGVVFEQSWNSVWLRRSQHQTGVMMPFDSEVHFRIVVG